MKSYEEPSHDSDEDPGVLELRQNNHLLASELEIVFDKMEFQLAKLKNKRKKRISEEA